MRTITFRNPSRRDYRIVVGQDVQLLTDYQQGKKDGEAEGKILGLQPLGIAAGAALILGYQYARKTGRI